MHYWFYLHCYQWLALNYAALSNSTACTIQQYQTSGTKRSNSIVLAWEIWILYSFYHLKLHRVFFYGCKSIILTIVRYSKSVYCYYCHTLQHLQYCFIYKNAIAFYLQFLPFYAFCAFFFAKLIKLTCY